MPYHSQFEYGKVAASFARNGDVSQQTVFVS